MTRLRAGLAWVALAAAIVVPLGIAATSPLLAWRDPVYIAAGIAGIVAMALLLVQPLLAGGALPGLPIHRGKLIHRAIGAALLLAVAVHVGGLWITSPPDVIDALLIASPTPFSLWGVIAMWAVAASGLLAGLRRRLPLRPRTWRIVHAALASIIVAGSVTHALLIEGTMGTVSKTMLCILVVAAAAWVIADLRVWARRSPSR